MIIAKYTPTNLTWRAASLAQAGQWRTYELERTATTRCSTSARQTTRNGGYASMFDTREYQYDETLQRLRPPFYPILEGSLGHVLLARGEAPGLIRRRRARRGRERPLVLSRP